MKDARRPTCSARPPTRSRRPRRGRRRRSSPRWRRSGPSGVSSSARPRPRSGWRSPDAASALPLFESLEVLGRDRTLARLAAAPTALVGSPSDRSLSGQFRAYNACVNEVARPDAPHRRAAGRSPDHRHRPARGGHGRAEGTAGDPVRRARPDQRRVRGARTPGPQPQPGAADERPGRPDPAHHERHHPGGRPARGRRARGPAGLPHRPARLVRRRHDAGLARLDEVLPGHLDLLDKWFTSLLAPAQLDSLLRNLRIIRDAVRPEATAGAPRLAPHWDPRTDPRRRQSTEQRELQTAPSPTAAVFAREMYRQRSGATVDSVVATAIRRRLYLLHGDGTGPSRRRSGAHGRERGQGPQQLENAATRSRARNPRASITKLVVDTQGRRRNPRTSIRRRYGRYRGEEVGDERLRQQRREYGVRPPSGARGGVVGRRRGGRIGRRRRGRRRLPSCAGRVRPAGARRGARRHGLRAVHGPLTPPWPPSARWSQRASCTCCCSRHRARACSSAGSSAWPRRRA